MSLPKPPGRFGDDTMSVVTDPRANQAMVEFMKQNGMAELSKGPSIESNTCSREDLLNFLKDIHLGMLHVGDNIPYRLPEDDLTPVTNEVKIIKGADGQDMKLYITKPAKVTGPLPGIIFLHGGGMTTILTENIVFETWCRDLATGGGGAVVISVDFRNAYDHEKHELRPFPAGLNDCVVGAEWVQSHKDELGIEGKILVAGSSGGGNLAIATALKLKKDGKHAVDGVYARYPYISAAYGWPRDRLVKELPSLIEADGYSLSRESLAVQAKAYVSSDADYTNPLAWPYHATEEDLSGSVPHTILVDELDPLRDEGLVFARKLERAGVRTVTRLAVGMVHCAPELMRTALRDMRFADVEDMHGFIRRL